MYLLEQNAIKSKRESAARQRRELYEAHLKKETNARDQKVALVKRRDRLHAEIAELQQLYDSASFFSRMLGSGRKELNDLQAELLTTNKKIAKSQSIITESKQYRLRNKETIEEDKRLADENKRLTDEHKRLTDEHKRRIAGKWCGKSTLSATEKELLREWEEQNLH